MDYMSDNQDARRAWLLNFKNKISAQATALGLTVVEVNALQKAAVEQIYFIDTAVTALANYNSTVAARDEGAMTNIGFIRTEVARIKKQTTYNAAIGEDLQVIGLPNLFDAVNYKAKITGGTEAGVVRIKFVKNGVDGVNIYHRKKGEAKWLFLARDTRSPYDDHIVQAVAGQAEHWEYRAFGVVNDVEIGQPSDIVEVVFGG